MAHYDLYSSLGLDRAMDCSMISAELERRIAGGVATNPGGMEELDIARRILGDPAKRSMYDAKLADLQAADVNIVALRELANAELDPPSAPASPDGETHIQSGGSTSEKAREKFTQYSHQAQEKLSPVLSTAKSEVARSSNPVIAGTALVTLAAVLLAYGAYALATRDWDAVKVKKSANEFLSLIDERETTDWLRENAEATDLDALESTLEIGDGFRGVDRALEVSEPRVDRVVNSRPIAETFLLDADTWDDELSREGFSDLYFVRVEGEEGRPSTAGLAFGIRDGKPVLVEISNYFASETTSVFGLDS